MPAKILAKGSMFTSDDSAFNMGRSPNIVFAFGEDGFVLLEKPAKAVFAAVQ